MWFLFTTCICSLSHYGIMVQAYLKLSTSKITVNGWQLTEITQSATGFFRALSEVSLSLASNIPVICSTANSLSSSRYLTWKTNCNSITNYPMLSAASNNGGHFPPTSICSWQGGIQRALPKIKKKKKKRPEKLPKKIVSEKHIWLKKSLTKKSNTFSDITISSLRPTFRDWSQKVWKLRTAVSNYFLWKSFKNNLFRLNVGTELLWFSATWSPYVHKTKQDITNNHTL